MDLHTFAFSDTSCDILLNSLKVSSLLLMPQHTERQFTGHSSKSDIHGLLSAAPLEHVPSPDKISATHLLFKFSSLCNSTQSSSKDLT